MKKLNNKGYLLVEIIMAFAITFALLYFMMDIVIKMKNKNDDLLVDSIVKVDSTIVTNKLMEYAISDVKDNDTADAFCDNIKLYCNVIKYKDPNNPDVEKVVDILDETVSISYNPETDCKVDDNKISIKIPVDVKQIKNFDKDKNFDIIIDYNYKIIIDIYIPIVNSYNCKNSDDQWINDETKSYALEYTGRCQVIDDLEGNWRVKFLTSGDLTLSNDVNVDVFLVGAGVV